MIFRRLWPILLVVLLVNACSRNTISTKYYLLDIESTSNSVPHILQNLYVSPVEMDTVYDSERIVARTASHEVQYYGQHLWATPPAQAITDLIRTYFNATAEPQSAMYQLESTIVHLETVRDGEQLQAHLQANFWLVNTATTEVEARYRFNETRPLARNDLNEFARTVSEMLHEALSAFSTQAEAKLSGEQ